MTVGVGLRRIAKLSIVIGATYWLAVPQVGQAWRAIGMLNDRGLLLPIIGGLLAAAAILAYTQVTRLLFDRDERPGLWLTLGIVVAALGVNRLVPAGAAAGTIVTFRLFRRMGIERRRAGFVMAAQGLGSNVLLIVVIACAMVTALPTQGLAPNYLTAAAVGGVVIAAIAVLADAVWHARPWLYRVAGRVGSVVARFRAGMDPARVVEVVDSVCVQARQFGGRRSDARSAVVWGVSNWLLDAASLWVFLETAGADITPQTAVLVFGLANLAGFLPFTPGGLGVVDVTMTAALAGFGVPGGVAIIGVAGYRLSHYWLPIPAAACAYMLVSRHLARRPQIAALST